MKRLLPLLVLPMLLLAACSHTNRLAEFNINGRSALYRTSVSADAATALATVEPPTKDTPVQIAAAIGSVVLSGVSDRKLERAINRDSLGEAIGAGIRQATADYLGLRAVNSTAENPEVIIETVVEDCRLVSTSVGVCLQVSGNSRVLSRSTGQVIWENSESYEIPISQTYLAAFGPKPVATGASVFNVIQFLSLSEEELRAVLNGAASEAGREIGETLREDVADLHE